MFGSKSVGMGLPAMASALKHRWRLIHRNRGQAHSYKDLCLPQMFLADIKPSSVVIHCV
jgi:hypothetical protein